MADDNAPTTSYSDPIYDRLEVIASRVRRAKWIIIGFLLVCLVAGLVVRKVVGSNPHGASAAAFISAQDERDPDKRRAALNALAADEKATPFFRARAALELIQLALDEGRLDDGRSHLARARTLAGEAKSPELDLSVRLGAAAVAEDAGELDSALGDYESVERQSARFPVHGMTALLGQARILARQEKHAEIIQRLEPALTRTDEAAVALREVVQVAYWRAKRAIEGAPATIEPVVEKPADAPAADGAKPADAPAADGAAAPADAAKPADSAAQPADAAKPADATAPAPADPGQPAPAK